MLVLARGARVGAQEAPALQGLDGRLRPLMVGVGNGQACPALT